MLLKYEAFLTPLPLTFSDISVIQSTTTPLPPPSISLSLSPPVSAAPSLHPSVLYLAFCLTISCRFPFFFHLHLTPLFAVTSRLRFSYPPQPNASLHLLSLSLSVFSSGGPFSISAPLLQINDLICCNKQVSSTLSPVHFPPAPPSRNTTAARLREWKEGGKRRRDDKYAM